MNFRPLYFYLQNVSVDGGLIYESFWCLCPAAVWRVAVVEVRYWSNHSSSCVNWEIGSGLWSPVSTSPLQTEIQSYNVAGDTGTNYVWD